MSSKIKMTTHASRVGADTEKLKRFKENKKRFKQIDKMPRRRTKTKQIPADVWTRAGFNSKKEGMDAYRRLSRMFKDNKVNPIKKNQDVSNFYRAFKDIVERAEKKISNKIFKSFNLGQLYEEQESREGSVKKTVSFQLKRQSPDLLAMYNQVEPRLKFIISRYGLPCKIGLTATVEFIHSTSGVKDEQNINSKSSWIVLNQNKLHEQLGKMIEHVSNALSKWQRNGSGWVVSRVVSFKIDWYNYNPIGGSSYVELDDYIKNKKAVINIKNKDNYCFLYCMLLSQTIDENGKKPKDPQRVKQYEERLKKTPFDPKDFEPRGLPISKIDKYEQMFQRNIHVFIYSLQNPKQVKPFRRSVTTFEKSTFLLCVQDNEKQHYCFITNERESLSRLLLTEKQKNHGYYCLNCLNSFREEPSLRKHEEVCHENETVRVSIPSDPVICFKHFSHMQRAPVVIYADFEAFDKRAVSVPSNDKHLVESTQEAFAWCIYVVSTVPLSFMNNKKKGLFIKIAGGYGYSQNLKHAKTHIHVRTTIDKSDGVMTDFWKTLTYIGKKVNYDLFNNPTKMKITKHQQEQHDKADCCYICKSKFNPEMEGKSKVRDHDHVSGDYTGPACNTCNLKRKLKRVIPVFFHNLKGYDGNILLKSLTPSTVGDNQKLNLKPILQTSEKMTGVEVVYGKDTFHEDSKSFSFIFRDSLCHLDSSIETLAEILDDNDFKNLSLFTKSPEEFKLLRVKGYCPYEYLSKDRLKETSLPSIENSFSRISDAYSIKTDDNKYFKKVDDYEDIENKEKSKLNHRHGQNVWEVFQCRNLSDYISLYLVSDVLLLADIFEKYRETGLKEDLLDPAYYYTLPSYTWDTMLLSKLQKKEEIRLVENLEHQLYIESSILGGISMVRHRHAKADNKYTRKDNTEKDTDTYIILVDANALYSGCMLKQLPARDWVDEEATLDNMNKWLEKDLFTCDRIAFIEVDAYLPPCNQKMHRADCTCLHDKQNDLPMFPEMVKPNKSLLSEKQVMQMDDFKIQIGQVKKVVPNLHAKKKYICLAHNLQLYRQHGWVITKCRRILSAKQDYVLRDFIQKQMDNRKNAKSKFEQDYSKLKSNASYGKTFENVRKYAKTHIVESNSKKFQKLVNKFNFNSSFSINHHYEQVDMRKTDVELNKPIHLGAAILNLSKYFMYDYYYNHLMKRYGPDKCKLLMMDTDSFCCMIQTKDIYRDMKEDSHLYDFSNYPENHECYDNTNKKIPLKFKDEMGGIPVREFVGIRAKNYSLVDTNNKQKSTAKGHKKIIRDKLSHEMFKSCILENQTSTATTTSIKSFKHQLTTYKQTKKLLCPFDDKAYYLEDNVTAIAFGHAKIERLRVSN